MKEKIRSARLDTPRARRHMFLVVIVLNVALLGGAFTLYGRYTQAYQESLREENLSNIGNLNLSASTVATSLFKNWNTKLEDLAAYIAYNDMNYDQALSLISTSNSTETRHFQLIDSAYQGHLARRNADGSYPEISYANGSYVVQQKAFDDTLDNGSSGIRFVPEFTDSYTGEHEFALYKHVSLRQADGSHAVYTLLLAAKTDDVLAEFNNQRGYEGQTTVLMNAKGDYIVRNSDFKSANFFQFLYTYNDLTLDERNAIRQEVWDKSSGELFYKSARAADGDCVFRYEKMVTSDWYCVTMVPVSSFRTPVFDARYIIFTVLMLVAMLAVDTAWMQRINRRLRTSIAREMEANAAKGSFMSRMSHEIRTPLSAIIGYNTLARNAMAEVKDEVTRRQAEMKTLDCLNKSSIASKHLLTIINDVLDMSAIESGKIKVAHERFDFKAVITSLTTVYYSQAKSKGVDLEVLFDTLTEEWFVGDQMRINQILTNLLSNAVKFTPDGGHVRLRISQPEAETNAAHIRFEVSDDGIGMTKEYLAHIWDPFEQADSSISRRFGGTGLGLSITKNLVDLMHGTISAQSEEGAGSTFCVDLTFERTEQPVQGEIYDFSHINALVVDDDSYTCDYVMQLFARCGARCATASCGEEGIKRFTDAINKDDPYTICLVDWRMPGMDGIETIRQLREIAGAEIPIIVVTAYDFTEIASQAHQVGVTTFLAKPLFQSSLFDLLANISGRQTPKTVTAEAVYDFSGAGVLLVEDNEMNMEIAKNLLESSKLRVDTAWNGQEAVDQFISAKPNTYQAILMDVRMPIMDGYEATRKIRSSDHPQAKTVPIIAMTADAFTENVAESLAAGMNDHISKPIDVDFLFRKLDEYINGKH